MSDRPTFERIVTFEPAYDKRHADPSKNYGIHGVTLRMVLKGPLGATQFVLYTNWHLPHVTEAHERDPTYPVWMWKPMPCDKGYHWPTPQYEGQDSMVCAVLPAGKCYYDGSGLNAERTYKALLTKGSEGVWADLEEFYNDLATHGESNG